MAKTISKRLLSLLCCICFMAGFMSRFAGNVAFAANYCTIDVLGDNFSVDAENKAYNYTTNGESSGSMSVIYQADSSSEPVECTPNSEGKITDIPVGAVVVFVLSPKEGFIPQLKINNIDVTLSKSPEDENVYLGSIQAPNEGISAQANFVARDNASIILNLKCVVSKAIQSTNYDDNFKSTWATIEYSSDGGTTYNELNEGTTASGDGKYTFDSQIDEIKLKITWANEIMAILDQKLVQNGSETTLSKGEHTAIFQESVYTLVWSYTANDIDESLLTKNGKISVDSGDGIEGTENEKGGVYAVKPGTEVKIHFIPDYGYQFSQGTIGKDIKVTPNENQSTFTFTMPKDQVVVGNIFTEHPNDVNIMTNSVVSGSISGAEKVMNSGNAALTVSDSVITSDEKSKINSFASQNGLEPVEYLDMELTNFLLKGNTGEKWENLLAGTNSPIGISLTLADHLKSSDAYSVIRVHGNDISVLDTKYNSSSGVLSFETDSFSTYVIAKKSGSASGNIFSAGNLKTGDQNRLWIYSLMMTASVAGFIYTFRNPKKRKFTM